MKKTLVLLSVLIIICVVIFLAIQKKKTTLTTQPIKQNQQLKNDKQEGNSKLDKQMEQKEQEKGVKKFINEGYGYSVGFEFIYLEDMFVRDCNGFAGLSFDSKDITECGEGNKSLTPIIVISNDYPAFYHSWEEYTDLKEKNYNENYNQVTIQELKIGSVPAKIFSGIIKEKEQLTDAFMRDFDVYVAGERLTTVLVRGDDRYFSLMLSYNRIEDEDIERYEAAFDDITSSFKARSE
ncbi:MAG: hypothetical protein U9O20_04410 [Patescibacteria group bacterium]|nr:hypothetical protein [Patescibacteria group bacterium]